MEIVSHVNNGSDDTKQLLCKIEQQIIENGDFEGSASELIEQIDGIDCPKNRITNILNMNVITLRNTYNVSYSYKRTNCKRIISLKSLTDSDTEIVGKCIDNKCHCHETTN